MLIILKDNLVSGGHDPISELRNFIANVSQHNELFVPSRQLMAQLLKWYISLADAWEAILDRDV
jgi:hypothetical protein